MHVIRVELPKQQNEIEVHVIADVHLSDPNCDIRGVQKRVADIAERDNAYVILAGDLIDNATRSSIGDIYSTQLSPMEQIQLANKTFAPLKGRILCAVPGNHEERTYRADGIDITWLIANELGAGNRYAPDAALVFVSLGENSRRKSEGRQTTYSIYVNHGNGGGRKIGGKINRLADYAQIVDADVYVCGHTHSPAVFKDCFFRTNASTRSAEPVERWRAQRDAREAAKAAQEQSQKTGEIVNESAENAVESQNSDNFADVQQREAETDAGRRGTLPEGQGAKSAEFGYDEARTQTRSTDGVLTDAERRMEGLRPEDRVHKVNHDAEVDTKAQERFESDYEGEKADLFDEKQDWDDTDTVLAHKIIVNEVAKARESGSKDAYAEVAKLMKEWDAHGTEAGQALRQRRQLASDPALMEADAIQLLNDSERTRKMSDEQRKKILDSVSQNAEKLRGIEKGDVDGVVDLIKSMSTERRTNGLWSNKMGRTMEKALEQAKKLPGGEAFLRDVAASQVRGIAYDYAKPSTLEQIKTYRYLSMLSKPATAARNLVGNMVYDPVEAVSNNIGVGLDMLLSKYSGTRSVAADKSYFSKAKRKGMGEATLKSYIETGLDASVSNAQGKYETGGSRSFKMTGNFLERFLSTWEKYSNYAMVTTDQMQKGGIQAEAQRGIDALEAKGKVAKGALDGRAEEIARERTFQNEGKLSGVMGGMRNALNKLSIKDKQGGSIGLGDIMLPFTNVPGNIASAAIQYSPAGFINAGTEVVKVLNKAKAGTLTASEQAKAVTDFGRAFNGTMGIALFAVLAGAGVMNVAGDDDEDEEALEKSEGVSGTQLNLSALNRWIAGESTEWRDGDDLVSIGFLDPINAQMTYVEIHGHDA